MCEFNLSNLFNNYSEVKMSAIIGNISEFDNNEESWDSYIERFELFLLCNDVSENKKVSTLLTVVGVKTFKLLRDLCTPDKPSTKTYAQLVKLIKDHLYPTPSFIAERYRFSLRNQLEQESVVQYLAQLKHLSTHCQFADKLNDHLRDRLVGGLRSESVKQRLLAEKDLSLDRAVELASQTEYSERDAAVFATRGSGVDREGGGRLHVMNKVDSRRQWRPVSSNNTAHPPGSSSKHNSWGERHSTSSKFSQPSKSNQLSSASVVCYTCGGKGHTSRQCKFRGVTCFKCGKVNHLAKVCRSTNSKSNSQSSHSNSNKFGKNKHNYVENSNVNAIESDDMEYNLGNLFEMEESNISSLSKNNTNLIKVEPFKADIEVDHKIITFEVDSGASVSVISDSFYNEKLSNLQLLPTEMKLNSYNNSPIETVGKLEVNVTYNSVSKVLPLYVIKNGSQPLIGRDWIKQLGIVISFSDKPSDCLFTEQKVSNHDNLIKKLVSLYPEVFSDELGQCNCEPIHLVLKEGSQPKYHSPRPLPYALKNKVELELERLVQSGILQPVNSSEYGTPIVPVPKKDGNIRICGDFRYVNSQLVVERYPVPRIEDLFAELQKGELYSKIDLSQAYMQLRLDEASQKLCTISTHKGLFSYLRLPYGISSAVAIFQRVIEQALQGLQGVKCFLDDIIITGPNNETHFTRLTQVCDRLRKVGFTVKQNKCEFFMPKLEFLGFQIDKNGLHTSQSKVRAITEAPIPVNVTQVKAFVGLINYYGKFVPNLSTVLSPLYRLLRKNVPFDFDKNCVESFNKVKRLLAEAPVLVHFDTEAQVVLTCDASNYGLGAVLSIIDQNGIEKPVSYASRTLNSAEMNYSQIDKEALSVVYGVKKFYQYLYGKHFILKSDHKPLISIFGPKKNLPLFAASRLQRYAVYLSGFDFDIKYVKSDANSADALSRLPLKITSKVTEPELLWLGTYLHYVKESSFPVTCDHVKIETQKDPVLKKVLGYVLYGWPNNMSKEEFELFPYFQRRQELSVEQGVLLWGYKIIIPSSLRGYVLQELHASHLGITKMKAVARSYLWYPNLDKDIELMANSCTSCLLERPNPNKSVLHHWHYPKKPWERIHVDHLGPFKNKLYLVVVDAYSKWLEVFETSSTSANQTIKHFRELFARFGLPVSVHSDNGPPFNSLEFSTFLKQNGVNHTTSAPYHPQSNGLAENSIRYAKNKLKCAFRENIDVSVALNRILFDYRNSMHLTTNETPAQLMFGRPLRTRLDLLRPNLPEIVEAKQQKQRMYAGGSKTRNLFLNQLVLCRNFRGREKWVVGNVFKILSPVLYLVKLSSGVIWKRHVDQLMAVDTAPDFDTDVTSAPNVYTAPAVRQATAPADCEVAGTPTPHTPTRSPQRPQPIRQSIDRRTPAVPFHSPTITPRTAHTSPYQSRRYPERIRKPIDRLNL